MMDVGVAPPTVTGGSALPPSVNELFDAELRCHLIDLRRAIHADPELSFQEQRTAEKLERALAPFAGDTVRRVASTGVVARVRGRDRSAPLVAIRGDIDALPVREETGLPFASRNEGVMHACGHDVHATWAVGAAALLARKPATGDVLILLQPAEETGKGAPAMLETGVLDDVQAIFGGHVDRRFSVGDVVADEGPLAASADMFEIVLVGQGAHAARPHESADPIVGLGALIGAIQTIVSRRLNPAHPGVVTIGAVRAGTASNVIPDRATLEGTVRAVDAPSRRLMLDEVKRIAEAIAVSYRLTAEVTLDLGTPPIVNPPNATAWARRAAESLLGEDHVVPLGFLNLAGEDFAHYMERIPGCFLRIGAREPGGSAIPAHAPKFYAAEESIFVGAAVLAETARVASRDLASRRSSED
jgi:hippurate hydrolase